MTSFKDCITKGAEATDNWRVKNKINQMVTDYDEAYAVMRKRGLSDKQSEIAASEHVTNAHANKAKAMRKKVLLQAAKNKQIEQFIRKSDDPKVAISAMFDFNDKIKGVPNYMLARQTATAQMFGIGHKALEELSLSTKERIANAAGKYKPKALHDEVMRELGGEATGNQNARELATALGKMLKYARGRANDLGANIGIIKHYIPQKKAHDAGKLLKAGFEKWRTEVSSLLKWEEMTHKKTGLPILDGEKDQYLQNVYDTIVSNGMNKIDPLDLAKDANFEKSFEHDRSLIFKDVDSRIKYQEMFGEGTIMDSIIAHIESMAHHIALMEIFGASPKQGFDTALATVKKQSTELKKTNPDYQLSDGNIDSYETMFGRITGQYHPINGKMLSVGNILTDTFYATALNATTITAVASDSANMAKTANYNKMKGVHAAVAKSAYRSFVQLFPELIGAESNTTTEFKRAMGSGGIVIDDYLDRSATAMRMQGYVYGEQFTSRITDLIMRSTLINRWTENARLAIMELMQSNMADLISKSKSEMRPEHQRLLDKYGVSERDWQEISQTKLYNYKGANWLRPADIVSPALQKKYFNMLYGETEMSVYSRPHLQATQLLKGNSQRGTLSGEVINSFGMLKNFSASIYFTHWNRAMAQASIESKAHYIATYMAYAMVGATAAIYMNDLAKGKKPRNPANMSAEELFAFGGEVFMKAGGAGFLGDFIYATQNQYGQGLDSYIAGPNVGTIADIGNLAFQIPDLIKGEDTNIAGDAFSLGRRFVPKPWYIELAVNRLILDELQKIVDPKAEAKFRRQKQFLEQEKNQEFYAPPGEGLF